MSRFYSNVLFYNSFFFFFRKILRKYRNVSDNLLPPPFPPTSRYYFARSVCISVKNTHNKCPRGNTFIRPLTTDLCSFSHIHGHFHLLLNYSYFSTADAPFAGADAAGVLSSEMRLSSRFPIVFYHRLATRRYPTTIDRPTKKRSLLSSPVDWVTVVDTTAKQTPKRR